MGYIKLEILTYLWTLGTLAVLASASGAWIQRVSISRKKKLREEKYTFVDWIKESRYFLMRANKMYLQQKKEEGKRRFGPAVDYAISRRKERIESLQYLLKGEKCKYAVEAIRKMEREYWSEWDTEFLTHLGNFTSEENGYFYISLLEEESDFIYKGLLGEIPDFFARGVVIG